LIGAGPLDGHWLVTLWGVSMRRIVLVLLALCGLIIVPLVRAASSDAAPTLPAGFDVVSYPTGQAAYNLTNFVWLADGGLLTSGKDGTITYVPPGGAPTVITQVPGVRAIGDHGLLGFAPANDYASTGVVYVSYDKGDPATTGFGMVEQWVASPPEAPTSFTYQRTIIDGSTMSPQLLEVGLTHSIDSVVVAPDDTLFVSIGDNSKNNGDPATLRSQQLRQPYGKLLHITPDGAAVPTNPFYDAAAPKTWRSMVYAYGFRNPFRFALDPRSGIVHLGDVGWNTVEEVDTIRAGDNAGWPCFEGHAKPAFISSTPTCQALYASHSARMPIVTYRHLGVGAAVVGGMFYTGESYPAAYSDAFFYGDYARGELWTLATDTTGSLTRGPEDPSFGSGLGGPVAFQPGPNGDVTFADLVGGDVMRLVYTNGNRPPTAQMSVTTDPDTRTAQFSAADSYDLDGDQLSYSWDFGDGSPPAAGVTTMHTYADDAAVQVTLTVTDELGATGSVTQTVHPANHTPQLELTVPSPPLTYSVGQPVDLSATAVDEEDGPLAVSWSTYLLHCPFAGSCHVHPGESSSGPTYSQPFTDHGADTVMVITAAATDSAGATATATYVAEPTLHTVTVTSAVAVTINGVVAASAQAVTASDVSVSAPKKSSYWLFKDWSDGGTAAHSFVMPDSDVSLVADYWTAIDAKFASIAHPWRLLGRATDAEHPVIGGRARTYLRGRIYWSAATGAHEVHGPILDRYLARGAQRSCLGFPVSDVVHIDGGAQSRFSGGMITYLRDTNRTVVTC
jgi:glucose/arabinose dehydrogenase/PKD repeat protein